MVKLQQNKQIFFIAIPIDYIRAFGWQKGQELLVYPTGEKQLVVKEQKAGENDG